MKSHLSVEMEHHVLYLTEYFPNFEGYNGGGAERVLERLITVYSRRYPNTYHPHLHVAAKKVEGLQSTLPAVITEDPEKQKLPELMRMYADSKGILHLGNTYLIGRHLELFADLMRMWNGPVILRVTLSSKILSLCERIGKPAAQEILTPIDVFISQSNQMTRELRSMEIPSEKIVQIENGIDCTLKSPLPAEQKSELRKQILPKEQLHNTVFLYAARLTDHVKKADELLKQWVEYGFGTQQCTLILAGNLKEHPGHESAFGKLLASYSVDDLLRHNVVLTGLLPENELEDYYRIADVYVTPSVNEGFSNSVLEAMSFGLPAVGRIGVSGHEELIVHNVTGFDFHSEKEMAVYMHKLCDASVRGLMSKAARAHVVSNYSIEHMVDKYKALYDSLRHEG